MVNPESMQRINAILLSLIGDLVAVTSTKMAIADSRHWPVGIYFFVLAFLDQLLKASNMFFNSNQLQKECMDRVLGPRVGGSIPVDHFIYGFCDLRREVTQIWGILGFFVQFLMPCIRELLIVMLHIESRYCNSNSRPKTIYHCIPSQKIPLHHTHAIEKNKHFFCFYFLQITAFVEGNVI
ncbi:hypothetical protein BJV82DRAFT_126154 [Fennellomyces sp. T-0311]|nr:hypothetical protein BJV82DRAFT_126154 [Fennellomyces sp. T-0311]